MKLSLLSFLWLLAGCNSSATKHTNASPTQETNLIPATFEKSSWQYFLQHLPGSPGHCTLVVDEATTADGKKVYKLAEGYSPAQSIYILRSTAGAVLDLWQPVKTGGPVQTASCIFYDYQLGSFE